MNSPPIAAARRRVRDFVDLYPFEPHFFQTTVGWQHYIDVGPRKAPPLLCVHGNPTWSFIWRRVAQRFATSYRILAPDHIGCGLSEKPRDFSYRLADHIANLEQFVLEHELDDITLIVHDWGGAIGMGVAVRHPERFARLVISNSAAFPASLIPKRIAICRTPLVGELVLRSLGAFERAAVHMATTRPLTSEVRRALLAPYGNWHERIAIARFVQDIPMNTTHPSWSTLVGIADRLGHLRRKPMALVWGERDFCFSPHFRHKWQERFPRAEVHPLPRAGHYLFEDEPEDYLEKLAGFLSRHPLRRESAGA